PGTGHRSPVRCDEKHLQPHMYDRLFAGEGQRLYGHIRTRARDIPAIRLFGDRGRLDCALDRPTPPHGDTPDLGRDQIPAVQVRAVAMLLVGEGVRAPAAMGAGEAGLLPGCYPAEEGVRRRVQPRQHIVPHLAVAGRVLREGGAHPLQFALLLEAGGGAPLPAPPPGDALFEGDVVARATAPQDTLQRTLLGRRGTAWDGACPET